MQKKDIHKMSITKPERNRPLERPKNGRITLKHILKKYGVKM
jgi:hypothetical protein